MLSREDACEMLEIAEAKIAKYEALLMDIEELLFSLHKPLVWFRGRGRDNESRFTLIARAHSAIVDTIGEDKFYVLLKERESE